MSRAIHLSAGDVSIYVNPSKFFKLPFARQRMIAAQILHAQGDHRAWLLMRNNPVLTRFIIDHN